MKVVIVNYGVGNIGSIHHMLNRIGVRAQYSSDHSDIENADKIILPGVGSFDAGMRQLKNSGLIPVLEKKILHEKKLVLGICLGMQMLFDHSEEGNEKGLAWLKGTSVKFSLPHLKKLKIPHMGWNTALPTKADSLFRTFTSNPRFYFVHSFHVVCENENNVLSRTDYGYPFVSAVQHENIYGVQFHPEKSHRYGMELLKNFVEHA